MSSNSPRRLEPQDSAALVAAGAALGIDLDPVAASKLISYVGLIEKWNGVYNLTSVRQPEAMLTQHIVDSLGVVAPLVRHSRGQALRIVDVGSGAGLPGVVIAITEPRFAVLSVDAVGKKASFIQQVRAELGIQNLEARHTRVEQLKGTQFDVAISRAFSSLADFVTLTSTLVAPDGVWLAMKGKVPDSEIKDLPQGFEVFHVEHLKIPGLDADRCLVWMKRT